MRICDILVSTFQQYPSGSQNDVVVATVLAQVVVTTRFTPLVSAAVSVILVGAMPWPVAQRTEKEGQNPDGGADADEGADNGNPSKKQRMEATATACACDCLVANNRIESLFLRQTVTPESGYVVGVVVAAMQTANLSHVESIFMSP